MLDAINHVYVSPFMDPALNLALEEYLFKSFEETILLLYCNQASVIIGKHQNPFAEVDMKLLQNRGLKLFRRISGGGTVFHDAGNVNYSFLHTRRDGQQQVDFPSFLDIIIACLKLWGIEASIGLRNELLVAGKKVSGTACHIFKNRSIHHGSLLIDTDLALLRDMVAKDKARYVSKAVASVSSEVLNLGTLCSDLEVASWISQTVSYISEHGVGVKPLILDEKDWRKIHVLRAEKYLLDRWNYDYTPRFTYKGDNGILLEVTKGHVSDVQSSFGSVEDSSLLGCSFYALITEGVLDSESYL